MKNLEEFIKTKYIQGKSYKFLLEYLTEDGHDLESCENIISAIHYKYWQKRKRTGIKDIFISIAGIITFLTWTIFIIINKEFSGNVIYYISIFIWVPFSNSAYIIFTSKNQFGQRKSNEILDSPL